MPAGLERPLRRWAWNASAADRGVVGAWLHDRAQSRGPLAPAASRRGKFARDPLHRARRRIFLAILATLGLLGDYLAPAQPTNAPPNLERPAPSRTLGATLYSYAVARRPPRHPPDERPAQRQAERQASVGASQSAPPRRRSRWAESAFRSVHSRTLASATSTCSQHESAGRTLDPRRPRSRRRRRPGGGSGFGLGRRPPARRGATRGRAAAASAAAASGSPGGGPAPRARQRRRGQRENIGVPREVGGDVLESSAERRGERLAVRRRRGGESVPAEERMPAILQPPRGGAGRDERCTSDRRIARRDRVCWTRPADEIAWRRARARAPSMSACVEGALSVTCDVEPQRLLVEEARRPLSTAAVQLERAAARARRAG